MTYCNDRLQRSVQLIHIGEDLLEALTPINQHLLKAFLLLLQSSPLLWFLLCIIYYCVLVLWLTMEMSATRASRCCSKYVFSRVPPTPPPPPVAVAERWWSIFFMADCRAVGCSVEFKSEADMHLELQGKTKSRDISKSRDHKSQIR